MDRAIQHLIDSKERLLTFLSNEIRRASYDYETFGKKIEQPLISELITVLEEDEFLTGPHRIARNKNEFPDLTIFQPPDIALDIKAGNRSQYSKESKTWRGCINSNNDLGTLNSWPDKLRKFKGEKIYFLFIEYNFTNKHQEIIDVKIDHFYRFIGLNEDGFLSYREKDGNLRTKNFDASPPVKTFEQFCQLFTPTVIYRSKKIIEKHVVNIPNVERNAFLDSLKI